MKELEKFFIGKGQVKDFKFTQLLHNNLCYLYEVDTGDSKHYEIFEHKEAKATSVMLGGVLVEYQDRVLYPKESAFGIWAKCINNYEKALDTYNQMTAQVLTRKDKKGNDSGSKIKE